MGLQGQAYRSVLGSTGVPFGNLSLHSCCHTPHNWPPGMPLLPPSPGSGITAEEAEVVFDPSPPLPADFLLFLSLLAQSSFCSLQLLTKVLANDYLYPDPNIPGGHLWRDFFFFCAEMTDHRNNTSGLTEGIWEGDVLRVCCYITPYKRLSCLSVVTWGNFTTCYGWIVSPFQKKICWSPNPQYLRMWPYLETRSLPCLIKLKWSH